MAREEEIVSGIGNQRVKIANEIGIGIQRVREQAKIASMSTFQMTVIFMCETRSGRPVTKRCVTLA